MKQARITSQGIQDIDKRFVLILIFLATGIFAIIGGLASDQKDGSLMLFSLLGFIVGAVVDYTWLYSYYNNMLKFDNNKGILRFGAIYFISFLICVGLVFIPTLLWIFPAIMVALALTSNEMIGLLIGIYMLLFTCILSGANVAIDFSINLILGSFAIILFANVRRDYNIVSPFVINSLSILTVLVARIFIIPDTYSIYRKIIMIAISVISNSFIIALLLIAFGCIKGHKYLAKYDIINSPSFPVLVAYKNNFPESYSVIEQRVLVCEAICNKIAINNDALIACAYYSKISSFLHADKDNDIPPIEVQYDFPWELRVLLDECVSKCYISKESSLVYIVDQLLESLIAYRNVTNSDIFNVRDYTIIVNDIIDATINSSNMSNSLLSLDDLKHIREVILNQLLSDEIANIIKC